MPYAAPRPCTYPGCKTLAAKGSRCQAHPYEQNRTARAVEYNRWYKTARWKKNRAHYLHKNPLCVQCKGRGIIKAATIVDHVTPHKGDPVLFWDQTNWQGLCKRCHDRKTARYDGGFGNARATD